MQIVPFKPEHYALLRMQPAQASILSQMSERDLCELARYPSFTAMDERPYFCGGVLPIWAGRGLLWALLSEDAGKHMVALTRGVRRFLDAQTGRLEAAVDCDFEPGHRWVRMLGFELETPRMRAFKADGRDAAMYVRVQP
jgi:hypothetical protein